MIFHITSAAEWAAAQQHGTYEPPSLASEGFIHLSTEEQTLATAARYYANASDLLLLSVDEDVLAHELRWEAPPDPARAHERYPHLYGPLATAEVIDARPFTKNDQGEFVFPY
jgi:uncharacterized protein (DUF952 family)